MARDRTVKAGDGHRLPRDRWWQMFSRSLFHLRLVGEGGVPETWSIDVRRGVTPIGEVRAQLYRDGVILDGGVFDAAD